MTDTDIIAEIDRRIARANAKAAACRTGDRSIGTKAEREAIGGNASGAARALRNLRTFITNNGAST